MNTSEVIKIAKLQLLKGTLYYIWQIVYIISMIFIIPFFVSFIIDILTKQPIRLDFGFWGGVIFCLIITFVKGRRYLKTCYLSIKLNWIRYKCIKIIEDVKFGKIRDIMIKEFTSNELGSFMNDYKL